MYNRSWYPFLIYNCLYFFIIILFINVIGPHLDSSQVKKYNIILAVILFVLTFTVIKSERMSLRAIGLSINRLLPGMLGLLILWLIVDTVCLVGVYWEKGWVSWLSFIDYKKTSVWSAYNFAYYWLLVGPVEEIAFRGYIQNKLGVLLEGQYGSGRHVIPVALTSVLFCLYHLPAIISSTPELNRAIIYGLFYLTVMGALFGYMYARSNNLFLVIFMHSSIDYPLPWVIGTWGSGLHFSPFIYTALLCFTVLSTMEIYCRVRKITDSSESSIVK